MTGLFGWQSETPLILASASKTRRDLLAALELPFDVIRPDIDEAGIAKEMLKASSSVADIAAALARAKALVISTQNPARYVLAADQTLECKGKLFMKAETPGDLRANLETLAGQTHHLWSAASLVKDGVILWSGLEKATMQMLPLTSAFLDDYLERKGRDMLHSVGGYEIERYGPMLFETIDGHHATILGLPLQSMLAAFRSLGLLRT